MAKRNNHSPIFFEGEKTKQQELKKIDPESNEEEHESLLSSNSSSSTVTMKVECLEATWIEKYFIFLFCFNFLSLFIGYLILCFDFYLDCESLNTGKRLTKKNCNINF